MKAILDFLNENQGALMVLITTVYVIATVVITCASIKAANATRAQIAESRWQYEDKKRLEIKPYIQFEMGRFDDSSKHCIQHALTSGNNSVKSLEKSLNFHLNMKNIGNGTAKDIKYTYYWDNGKSNHDNGAFPIQALSSSEQHSILFSLAYSSQETEDLTAAFLFRFKDLLENEYNQTLSVVFESPNTSLAKISEVSITPPILIDKENKNA